MSNATVTLVVGAAIALGGFIGFAKVRSENCGRNK